MNLPESEAALPLAYASELTIEMHLLRGECSETARALLKQQDPNSASLNECARLDEALAIAYRVLRSAVYDINRARITRQSQGSSGATP
ncbi:MAG TPA: hypothetical protein VN673_18265 [Clostridia bacterium]|nr:hypothetical protein [Clostridia bacterium]